MDETMEIIEKLQVTRANKKTKSGKKYIYRTFKVFISVELLETMNIADHMYLYYDGENVSVTNTCPDGSVPFKKLKISEQSSDSKPNWKRIFTLPKKFFPDAEEGDSVLFTLDETEVERFSGTPATLTITLIKGN